MNKYSCFSILALSLLSSVAQAKVQNLADIHWFADGSGGKVTAKKNLVTVKSTRSTGFGAYTELSTAVVGLNSFEYALSAIPGVSGTVNLLVGGISTPLVTLAAASVVTSTGFLTYVFAQPYTGPLMLTLLPSGNGVTFELRDLVEHPVAVLSPVPEPEIVSMLVSGLAVFAFVARQRRKTRPPLRTDLLA